MAILVQQTQAQFPNTTDCTLILPQTIGAGNLLILDFVAVPHTEGTLTWITGSSSDPVLAVSRLETAFGLYTVYRANATAGLHTIRGQLVAECDVAVAFTEYAGVLASPFDSITSNATGTGTAASSGATGTPTNADCLVHAAVTHASGGNVSATVDGADWERLAYLPDATFNAPLITSHKFISSAAAQTAEYTFASSVNWGAVVSVFYLIPGWTAPEAPAYPASRASG